MIVSFYRLAAASRYAGQIAAAHPSMMLDIIRTPHEAAGPVFTSGLFAVSVLSTAVRLLLLPTALTRPFARAGAIFRLNSCLLIFGKLVSPISGA